MNIPLPTIHQVPAVCRLLRTKAAMGTFVGNDFDAPWEMAESGTAAYWCLNTMSSAGPDDCFAHPQYCREGRSCYKARD